MKSTIFFLIIIFLFSLSCKKVPIKNVYNGTVKGLLFNNKSWPVPADWTAVSTGGIVPISKNCFAEVGYISVISLTSDGSIREGIGMSGLPLKTGKFNMIDAIVDTITACPTKPDVVIYLYAADGDVAAGIYYPLAVADNSITINSYDTNSGDVSGTFDITFVKKELTAYLFPYYTDTVRFSGGMFKAKWKR